MCQDERSSRPTLARDSGLHKPGTVVSRLAALSILVHCLLIMLSGGCRAPNLDSHSSADDGNTSAETTSDRSSQPPREFEIVPASYQQDAPANLAAAVRPPNIVLIVADDK